MLSLCPYTSIQEKRERLSHFLVRIYNLWWQLESAIANNCFLIPRFTLQRTIALWELNWQCDWTIWAWFIGLSRTYLGWAGPGRGRAGQHKPVDIYGLCMRAIAVKEFL